MSLPSIKLSTASFALVSDKLRSFFNKRASETFWTLISVIVKDEVIHDIKFTIFLYSVYYQIVALLFLDSTLLLIQMFL